MNAHFILPLPITPGAARGEPLVAYPISETQGPLTDTEREAIRARREQRRSSASAYLDEEAARRRGRAARPHQTLTGEEMVEAQHLAHERIREGEAAHRKHLRKKCSSITELAAVTPGQQVTPEKLG